MRRVLYALAWAGFGAASAMLIFAGARRSDLGDSVTKAESAAAKRGATPRPAPIPRRQLVNSRSRTLEIEQLQALGYVDGTYDPHSEQSDVLVYVKGKAQEGLNFYSSRKATGARLIDMDGHTVHEWNTRKKGAWQHAELLPNGDVIVIVKDHRLSRYDVRSKLLWSVEGRFHHDLSVVGDEIYVLSRTGRVVDYVHPRAPVLADVIQVRSMSEGTLQREISVLDAIHDSPYAFLLPSVRHAKGTRKNTEFDVLHTNHVEVLDGRSAHRIPAFAAGNILISMRNINAIAVLDGRTAEVSWIWGPTNLTFQHDPTLLENGHILLFDNGLERSRVLEVDPSSYEIVWAYAPRSGFLSKTRGSNQRLANGNTLITESDRGYVLEVTPDQEVVWKFANPVVTRKKEREAIWRMVRVDPASLDFLE